MNEKKTERRSGMNEIIPMIQHLTKEMAEIKTGQSETNEKVNFIHSKLFVQNGAPGLIQQFKENDEALAEAVKEAKENIKTGLKEIDEKKIQPLQKSIGKVKTKVNKILMFFAAFTALVLLAGGIVGIVTALI